jgi:hypothetical protein
MIQKEYDDEKKHIHVLSYGGGTQSTALLLMALEGKIEGVVPDYIIFSDTGWEPKPVNEWVAKVNTYIKEKYNREIIVASNGNIRDDIVAGVKEGKRHASVPFFTKDKTGLGSTGMTWRQCTGEYKIKPVNKQIRELLGYKKGQRVKEVIHTWKGISTDEIQRVKPSQLIWQVMEHPLVDLVDMDRDQCIEYVEATGLGTPPKSSCIGCPFHNNAMWLDMKKNDPESFADAVEIDELIRNHPKFNSQLFLHRKAIPLKDVEFHEQTDIDLFINECEGMCGV